MRREPRYPAGYAAHTTRTRKLIVEAELRHCWDLLTVLRECLHRTAEDGLGGLGLLPGEYYRLGALASTTCVRARKLLAEIEAAGESSKHEDEHRQEFLATLPDSAPPAKLPPWHVKRARRDPGACRRAGIRRNRD